MKISPICQLKPLNDTSNTSQGAISSSKLENWLKVFVYDTIFLYHLSRLPFPLPGQKETIVRGRSTLYLITCVLSHFSPVELFATLWTVLKQVYKFPYSILDWKLCLFTQLCPNICDHMNCSPQRAPLSMGISRQEYWNGFPFPLPRIFPSQGSASVH